MSKTSVKPDRRRRRPQHSDEKLLGAATRVFAQVGYDAATVDAVATEAGSTKPTLYARFGSKADLYTTAVEREIDTFLRQLFAVYQDAEHRQVEELVQAAVHGWFAYAEQHPDAFRLLFTTTADSPARPLFEQMRDTVTTRVIGLAEGAMARLGTTDRAVASLVGAMIVGACVDGARRMQDEPSLTTARASAVATAFILGAVSGLDRRLMDV
jgi:AcrR family transcriptional regulator